jgi:hypothetical protein
MSFSPTIESIRALVRDGDHESAVAQLLQLTERTDFEDEAILIQTDFLHIRANIRKSLWDEDTKALQLRKFTSTLLSFLRDMEKGIATPLNSDLPSGRPSNPPAPSTTDIVLFYQGDPYGCNLQLQISIGGKICHPQSNQVVLQDVPLGTQAFQVSGMITCLGLGGTAMASGSGNLIIQPQGRYGLRWQPTGIGMARVWFEQV